MDLRIDLWCLRRGPRCLLPWRCSQESFRRLVEDAEPEQELHSRRVSGHRSPWKHILRHTAYTPATNSDLSFSHWIVLRGAGLSTPFRVTRRSDLKRLLNQSPGQRPASGINVTPIVQGLASLCELRIFCGGASVAIPPLLRWRYQ